MIVNYLEITYPGFNDEKTDLGTWINPVFQRMTLPETGALSCNNREFTQSETELQV